MINSEAWRRPLPVYAVEGGDGGGADSVAASDDAAPGADSDASDGDSADARAADTGDNAGSEAAASADAETAEAEKTAEPVIPDNWRDLAADGDEDTLKLLKRYGSIKGVAKALREANDKIRTGKVKTAMPDPKDEAAMKEWRKSEGIPDDPTGYVLPDAVKKRMTDEDKPVIASFTEYAHTKGAPQAAVDIATEWYFDSLEQMQSKQIAEDKEASSEAEEELRKDWGAEYKPRMKLAASFVETIPGVGKDWAEARMPDGRRLGDIPAFMAWASDEGAAKFGDTAFVDSDSEARHSSRKAEIEGIMKTDINRYWSEGLDKEYAEIVAREQKRRS